jgi:hypothetical protein
MRKHGACMPGWRIGRGRARMQSGARGRPWPWPGVRSSPGSIPELGSSRSSTGRSATSAAATPSRRWLPPLRLPAALRAAQRRAYACVACTLRLLSLRALGGLEHHSASQTHWPTHRLARLVSAAPLQRFPPRPFNADMSLSPPTQHVHTNTARRPPVCVLLQPEALEKAGRHRAHEARGHAPQARVHVQYLARSHLRGQRTAHGARGGGAQQRLVSAGGVEAVCWMPQGRAPSWPAGLGCAAAGGGVGQNRRTGCFEGSLELWAVP